MNDTEDVDYEIYWRCKGCGRRSHARRQPKRHERRSLGYEDELAHGVSKEIQVGDADFVTWVWCGPFEKWVAKRIG